MLFTDIESIAKEGGQYLVLTDYGSEGLAVTSQHEELEGALLAYGNGLPQAIVMIPKISFEVC